MRLDHFDLNLLVAFDVLLTERSVTQAAKRLNVTQSAMSAALRRLREAFNDEILVQHRKNMIPTTRAQALAPEVASVILHLRSLITSAAAFDPRTSRRRFRIAASDYIATVLVAPLLDSLQREAPFIGLDVSLPNSASRKKMDDGDLDLLLTPEQFLGKEHPQELLFTERHIVVGCAKNPVFQKPLTIEGFLSCGHVVVRIAGQPTFIETALQDLGDSRRIEIIAPSFIQAPWMVRGTNRLTLMHERLAAILVEPLSLAVTDCPFALPVMNEMMQSHSARANDIGLLWMRNKLRMAAKASVPR